MHVYTVDIVYTVDTVDRVYTVSTVDIVYTVDMVYSVSCDMEHEGDEGDNFGKDRAAGSNTL